MDSLVQDFRHCTTEKHLNLFEYHQMIANFSLRNQSISILQKCITHFKKAHGVEDEFTYFVSDAGEEHKNSVCT